MNELYKLWKRKDASRTKGMTVTKKKLQAEHLGPKSNPSVATLFGKAASLMAATNGGTLAQKKVVVPKVYKS
jgi:hypothetical protein